MSMNFPYEDEIIISHTKEWLLNSSETVNSFATDILAPLLGKEAPETVPEYENWKTNLTRMVRRYFSGKNHMPLSWKWPWLEALPPKVRKDCLKEIYAVHGFLDTLPDIENGTACTATLNELLEAFAEVVSTAAPAHDGIYDKNDSQENADKYIDSLLTAAGKFIDEARKTHAGTGAVGKRHNIHHFSTTKES